MERGSPLEMPNGGQTTYAGSGRGLVAFKRTLSDSRCSPVIVHHGDDDGDALDVLVGDVKHQRLVVGGVQRVLLNGGLPLFQPPPVADQRGLHVRVCPGKEGEREIEGGSRGNEIRGLRCQVLRSQVSASTHRKA